MPGPFVRENFRYLHRVVTLDNGKGRKWKVSFKSASSRHPIWLRGWRIVARDNNLKPGDVMIFELVEISHFHITVFDDDGNISTDSTSRLKNAGRDFKREFRYSAHKSLPMPPTPKSNDSLSMSKSAKREYFSSGSDTQDSADFEKLRALYDVESAGLRSSFEKIRKPPACNRRRLLKLADIPMQTIINGDTEPEGNNYVTLSFVQPAWAH